MLILSSSYSLLEWTTIKFNILILTISKNFVNSSEQLNDSMSISMIFF